MKKTVYGLLIVSLRGETVALFSGEAQAYTVRYKWSKLVLTKQQQRK